MIGLQQRLSSFRSVARSFQRVHREEWLSPEELASRRRLRLRRVLAQAALAPFYHTAMLEVGVPELRKFEPEHLRRLVLVDRQVIARHGLGAFLTVGEAGLFGVTTSGSTGTPGRFLRSAAEEAEYSARWMRVYRAYKCSILDAQVNIASVVERDRAGPVAFLRRVGVLPRVEQLGAGAPPGEVLDRLAALRPPILTGYAGAIEALADHVLATGTRITPPRAVFCTAMEVTDRCLELAQQAFRAPAVDVYVTNELGVIAWSCPVRRDLLHLNDDCFIVEVVDPDGAPVPNGTSGELVVTSLGLTSMPLIRYRTGDMAALVPEPCRCGRGLALMTRVQGRTAHAIRRPGGGIIITPLVTNLFGQARAFEWVRAFQVREEPGCRLRVLLHPRVQPAEAQLELLAGTLRQGIGSDFAIELELVEDIPLAPSGKRQFLVPLPRS